MRGTRALGVHVVLLALAVLGAVLVWTRDKKPKALAAGDVTVWSIRADQIVMLSYEGKNKKVTLEPKKDAIGTYLVGTMEKTATPPKPAGDGGAPETPTPPATPTVTTLVSVGSGQKLLEALAPLKSVRAVGKIGLDRAAEFGLDAPEGTITVKLSNGEKKLVVGGPTPGGADRYVRDEASGEVYVLKGDVFRDFDSADSRLVERDLHEWKEADVAKAKVIAGDKSRELVRGSADNKKFWADPSSPSQNDETVGNWMSKLDRLRPSEFTAKEPEGKQTIVRVEYAETARSLGFIELAKVPPAGDGQKAEYYVLTERLRSWAKVPQNLAEQVETDLGSVVK